MTFMTRIVAHLTLHIILIIPVTGSKIIVIKCSFQQRVYSSAVLHYAISSYDSKVSLTYVEGAATSLRAESWCVHCFLLLAGLSFVMVFYQAQIILAQVFLLSSGVLLCSRQANCCLGTAYIMVLSLSQKYKQVAPRTQFSLTIYRYNFKEKTCTLSAYYEYQN